MTETSGWTSVCMFTVSALKRLFMNPTNTWSVTAWLNRSRGGENKNSADSRSVSLSNRCSASTRISMATTWWSTAAWSSPRSTTGGPTPETTATSTAAASDTWWETRCWRWTWRTRPLRYPRGVYEKIPPDYPSVSRRTAASRSLIHEVKGRAAETVVMCSDWAFPVWFC